MELRIEDSISYTIDGRLPNKGKVKYDSQFFFRLACAWGSECVCVRACVRARALRVRVHACVSLVLCTFSVYVCMCECVCVCACVSTIISLALHS